MTGFGDVDGSQTIATLFKTRLRALMRMCPFAHRRTLTLDRGSRTLAALESLEDLSRVPCGLRSCRVHARIRWTRMPIGVGCAMRKNATSDTPIAAPRGVRFLSSGGLGLQIRLLCRAALRWSRVPESPVSSKVIESGRLA